MHNYLFIPFFLYRLLHMFSGFTVENYNMSTRLPVPSYKYQPVPDSKHKDHHSMSCLQYINDCFSFSYYSHHRIISGKGFCMLFNVRKNFFPILVSDQNRPILCDQPPASAVCRFFSLTEHTLFPSKFPDGNYRICPSSSSS